MKPFAVLLFALPCIAGIPGYTNHAGHVITGAPSSLTEKDVTLGDTRLPLSIFPVAEQRRIAADAGQPLLPRKIKMAVEEIRKALERSKGRAAKGLCTPEQSIRFQEKTKTALRLYLKSRIQDGTISPAEEKAILSTFED